MAEWMFAYLTFALAGQLTPGPNNLMLAASGATFGYRRTIPHMLGITLGYPAMIIAVGFGLGHVFEAYPVVHTALKWAGSAYLLWLAWRIATAAGHGRGDKPARGRPLTFLEAAAFQWVNPKAWAMVLSILGVYTAQAQSYFAALVIIALLSVAVSVLSTSAWTLLGVGAGKLLNARQLVWFNRAMAALMVASLAVIWL